MTRFLLLLFMLIPVSTAHSEESADNTTLELVKKALSADAAGDYKTTYSIWESLYEKGDYKAAVSAGLMHHQGTGMPVDYVKAMDWYLRAVNYNADAMNNIGILYRDGLGIKKNRKISYLLFLTIHMEGMGVEETVMLANRNLRQEIDELSLIERQEALWYSLGYMAAYVESRGNTQKSPREIRETGKQPRVSDLGWWAPGEVGEFTCPANTSLFKRRSACSSQTDLSPT